MDLFQKYATLLERVESSPQKPISTIEPWELEFVLPDEPNASIPVLSPDGTIAIAFRIDDLHHAVAIPCGGHLIFQESFHNWDDLEDDWITDFHEASVPEVIKEAFMAL